MPQYVVERIRQILNQSGISFNQARILIVGVTYKKNIKDLRKSPALDIIEILQKNKTKVSYYDPLITYLKLNHINLKSINLKKNILMKFDCVVIATDHTSLNYSFILEYSKLIFDTRNVFRNIVSQKVIRL
jgi:UDP-N-acetyl-D-glucosamine dehydrogenase